MSRPEQLELELADLDSAALELLASAEGWVQALAAAAPPGEVGGLELARIWRQMLRGATPRERRARLRAAARRRAGIYHPLLCTDESVAAARRRRAPR